MFCLLRLSFLSCLTDFGVTLCCADVLQVCTYCSKFADPDFAFNFLAGTTDVSAHASFTAPAAGERVESGVDSALDATMQDMRADALHTVDGEPIVSGADDQKDVVAQEMEKPLGVV